MTAIGIRVHGKKICINADAIDLPQDGQRMISYLERIGESIYARDVIDRNNHLLPNLVYFHHLYTTLSGQWPLVFSTFHVCQMAENEEKLAVKERKAIVRRDRKIILSAIMKLIGMYFIRGRAHKQYFLGGIWPAMIKHGDHGVKMATK